MAFYPGADRSITGTNSGKYTGGPPKGVLHTTEGSGAAGAISAFRSSGSWPHFLLDPVGKIWQFVDTGLAARALRNLSGGVQTNRDYAIQVEIVGFAGKPAEHSAAQFDALRKLMRWVEATHAVKPVGPGRAFASAYGQRNLRFDGPTWDAFSGWCGHCHVAENDHWDPGTIDLASLLPGGTPAPPPPPPPSSGFSVPASYYTEVSSVPFTTSHPQGGYIVVGGDGGVYAYGAPFYGSLSGVALSTPIIDATWTATGAGYWLMSSDGAIFSFGDAAYKGGFNALSAEVRGSRKPIGIVAKGAGYRIVTLENDDSPFDGYDFGV